MYKGKTLYMDTWVDKKIWTVAETTLTPYSFSPSSF